MSELNEDWEAQAIALDSTGTMSKREISKLLGVPKSTLSDMLRKYYGTLAATNGPDVNHLPTHLVIFDTQVRPGIDLDYLRWIGEYIVRKQPDVIVMIGDHADMESLSSYDKGKRSAEKKRVKADINAAVQGMRTLLAPMWILQAQQREAGEPVYNPRMDLTLGNHEDRINRHTDANPELHEFLSIDALEYAEMGWNVHPFLTPVEIDGVYYCHYFPNVMTGKPLGGTSASMLPKIGTSFTMGHQQLLDIAVRTIPTTGQQQWGVKCGASYVHDEHYKGVMGNKHWRGIMVKHNVKDGSYDPLLISMDWLKQQYGTK
jgi:hypothetical protein